MNIFERKILINELLGYLTSVGDTEGAEWFNTQKILHDAPDDEFRKQEVMCYDVWQTFYDRIFTSFHLRHAVETFLEASA